MISAIVKAEPLTLDRRSTWVAPTPVATPAVAAPAPPLGNCSTHPSPP
jgi:hypothetical protein